MKCIITIVKKKFKIKMIEKKKMKTVSKCILIVYNVKIIRHLKQSFLIVLKFIINENS